jgi:TolB-like protein
MFETLGQYKILDWIGAGGMGEVCRARDMRLGRTVAIKVLAAGVADDQERRERFLLEARATAALSHPNIAALYEIGEDQGQLFLVFEFVPGETLKTAIAGRPLNPRRALDLAVQIADALADAHAAGIIHRDIKPDNIIVTPKGNAKILDFGLAAWTSGGAERDRAVTMTATDAGPTLGTVAYMSPEQALGEEVDQRTDIFSLGIVLFEMLTGKLPFAGTTAKALALQIVQAPAPAPSSVNPSVPRELDAIVAQALSKSLDQRYESAATVAAELRSVAAILDVRGTTSEPTVSTVARVPRGRTSDRSYVRAIVTAALFACVAAGAWIEREPIRRQWHRVVGPAPAPMIAVIPLDLVGGDPSQIYLADGFTEDLISRLGQTPGLKVLGRSATRGYRGRAPRDVARELGASVALTGSLESSADTAKLTLTLVDPDEGADLWTAHYALEVKDVFAVQARIAKEVASALRLTLQPSAASARAESRLVDPRAYDLYLRGRQAAAQRRRPEAIALYEQAIAVDAGLAEAFVGLAEALRLREGAGGDSADAVRLKTAAERAYQLDEDSPQANLAMALTKDSLAETLRFMRRAIEADPSFAEVYDQIGEQIQDFAPELSVAFYKRSLALEPGLTTGHSDLAVSYLLLNRLADARAELAAHEGAGRPLTIDIDERKYDAAIAELRSLPELRAGAPLWNTFVVVLASSGHRDDALRESVELAARFPSCESRAHAAGLRLDHGQAAAARQLADALLRDAASDSATPAALRCGARAAAAMKQTAQLAAILDRIASKEDRLRYWAKEINGETGSMLLKGRVYPFAGVVDSAPIADARARLEAAYVRQREVAREALSGLP